MLCHCFPWFPTSRRIRNLHQNMMSHRWCWSTWNLPSRGQNWLSTHSPTSDLNANGRLKERERDNIMTLTAKSFSKINRSKGQLNNTGKLISKDKTTHHLRNPMSRNAYDAIDDTSGRMTLRNAALGSTKCPTVDYWGCYGNLKKLQQKFCFLNELYYITMPLTHLTLECCTYFLHCSLLRPMVVEVSSPKNYSTIQCCHGDGPITMVTARSCWLNLAYSWRSLENKLKIW